MKCPKCGSDNVDGAKFCASCGTQLSKKPDEKIPVYLRVWCGILMTIVLTAITSSMWCLLLFPLLFAARLSEYPSRRKGAWLELVVTLCICGGLGYAIYYFENANQRTLDKHIQSGNYEEALAFVDEHFKTSDYAYYKAKADIFEASGDFDKAAEIVLRYCEQSDDLTSLNADAEERLTRYQGERVSSDTSLAIDAFHAQVISAKQEAEEEARIQQEAREAEERAAREAEFYKPVNVISRALYTDILANYGITPNHQSDRKELPGKIVNALSGASHYAKGGDVGLVDSLLEKYYVAISNMPGDYVYYGSVKDNRPDGFGVLCSDYVDLNDMTTTYMYLVSAGTFSKGMLNGYGALFDRGVVIYDGDFKNGWRDGKGNSFSFGYDVVDMSIQVMVTKVSDFKHGEQTGKIRWYNNDVLLYDGEVKNGAAHGKGVSYFANGQVRYNGEWKNGEYDGVGTLYDESGRKIYSGKWKKGDYAT